MPFATSDQGGDHAPAGLRRCPTSRICENVVDMDAIRAAGLTLGVDPARRRGAAVLGADQLDLQAEHHRRQSGDRSDVLVHDGGSRRQDPHGLVEPVRDGAARRAEGSLPRRVRQRSRLGSARHRDALGGADEPESLPGGGHPLPAHASPAVAERTPRSARRWSAAASSIAWSKSSAAGSTRCRSASSGSCRACSTARAASAARRAPGPAFCGTTAPCGRPTRTARSWTCWRPRSPPAPARIRVSTTASWRRSSARRATRASTRRPRRSRRRDCRKLSPEAVKEQTLAGEPITAKLTRAPGQQRADRRPEDRRPRAAGSRRGPPAPRTSTRSTRRASEDAAHLDALVSEAQAARRRRRESAHMSVPPFPTGYRASGLLLHVTSLPSPYGIGDVGPAAVAWIDRLHDGGAAMVAVAAAWPDRLRQFAVSVALVVRRQCAADQSRLADRGRTAAAGRLRRRGVSTTVGRLRRGSRRSSTACSRRLEELPCWRANGSAPRISSSFCGRARPLAGRLRVVPCAEGQIRRRQLPGVAGGPDARRPAALAQARPGAGEPGGPGAVRPVRHCSGRANG